MAPEEARGVGKMMKWSTIEVIHDRAYILRHRKNGKEPIVHILILDYAREMVKQFCVERLLPLYDHISCPKVRVYLLRLLFDQFRLVHNRHIVF